LDFRVLPIHRFLLRSDCLAEEGMTNYVRVLFCRAKLDLSNREAGAGQGRAQHGSAQRDAPLWRVRRKQ